MRKHRLIERLLTDFMGYRAAESHVHADELGDTFSEDMVERIASASASPSAARTAGRSTPGSSRPRTPSWRRCPSFRPGAREIVRLAEHDGELLHWFYEQGLEPGRELEVVGIARLRGRSRCGWTERSARLVTTPLPGSSSAPPPSATQRLPGLGLPRAQA